MIVEQTTSSGWFRAPGDQRTPGVGPGTPGTNIRNFNLKQTKCFVFYCFSYSVCLEKGSNQLFVTLYILPIDPSVHKQLLRTLFEAHIVFLVIRSIPYRNYNSYVFCVSRVSLLYNADGNFILMYFYVYDTYSFHKKSPYFFFIYIRQLWCLRKRTEKCSGNLKRSWIIHIGRRHIGILRKKLFSLGITEL